MAGRYALVLVGLAGLGAASPALASRTLPCGKGCTTDTQSPPTTIVPGDLNSRQFQQLGDDFESAGSEVTFTDGSAPLTLGFQVNFGGGATNLAYISQNGLLSFGAPLSAFQNSSLAGLNLPVIAPYYAKLAPSDPNGSVGMGDVVLQTGFADVYPDGGAYSARDLLPAVRITWYGVQRDTGRATAGAPPIYAQLVLAASEDGSYSTFKFRYGADADGEPRTGAIAGFALYGTDLEFGGPFTGTIPSFFEFSDGAFIGQGATTDGAVPEPATWAQLIAGFGLAGLALRRRRPRLQPA